MVLYGTLIMSEASALLRNVNLSATTVLIVEDNDGLRRMIVEVLRSSGFHQTVQARDAEEAIELLGAYNPDLMILDWNLPGLSGIELTLLLRQAAVHDDLRFPNPRIPVLMLTGRQRSRDVAEARNAGVDEFVIKPFSTRSLLRGVTSALCHPRPFIVSMRYVGPCRRRRRDADYRGLMRRVDDIEAAADRHSRILFQQGLSVELEALHALMAARGGLHKETLDYLIERTTEAETQAVKYRQKLLAEATRSLKEYVAFFGNETEPDVLDVHLGSIRRLNDLRNEEMPEAVAIIRQLEALVRNRKRKRLSA